MPDKKNPLVPSKCRSCDAAIYWAVTTLGKSTPVDAEAMPDGAWVLSFNEAHERLRVTKYDERTDEGRRRFTSHWQTCPSRDQHRAPKASAP